MIGSPCPTNADSDINVAPVPQRPNAAQPQASPRGDPLRLHSRPANATNQTSTDRSTCTTSATRKKSTPGNHSLIIGVRDSTSSSENSPEPIECEQAEPQPAARQLALRAGWDRERIAIAVRARRR